MTEVINKTIIVNARPETVFKALTDEKELIEWFPNQGAILEPRVGGKIEFKFLRPDGEKHTAYGRILEIVPNKRLSYSWSFIPGADSKEKITWALEPTDDGKTKITLLHTGFEKPGQKEMESGMDYESGWAYFIGRLVAHVK
jgi:uncharacterized protein YndB with AHSA1/START domain